jgi:hypothetical protein
MDVEDLKTEMEATLLALNTPSGHMEDVSRNPGGIGNGPFLVKNNSLAQPIEVSRDTAAVLVLGGYIDLSGYRGYWTLTAKGKADARMLKNSGQPEN